MQRDRGKLANTPSVADHRFTFGNEALLKEAC